MHLSRHLNDAPVVNIDESTWPVNVICSDYFDDTLNSINVNLNYSNNAIQTISQIHLRNAPGHILLFLSTYADIEIVCKKILDQRIVSYNDYDINALRLTPYPIYGGFQGIPLSTPEEFVGKDSSRIRLVFATTNAAYMPYMRQFEKNHYFPYVVDSGFVQQRKYNLKIDGNASNSLITLPVSSTIAKERTNQAKSGGICYRLYGGPGDTMCGSEGPDLPRVPREFIDHNECKKNDELNQQRIGKVLDFI